MEKAHLAGRQVRQRLVRSEAVCHPGRRPCAHKGSYGRKVNRSYVCVSCPGDGREVRHRKFVNWEAVRQWDKCRNSLDVLVIVSGSAPEPLWDALKLLSAWCDAAPVVVVASSELRRVDAGCPTPAIARIGRHSAGTAIMVRCAPAAERFAMGRFSFQGNYKQSNKVWRDK